jgi:hypothetical protein
VDCPAGLIPGGLVVKTVSVVRTYHVAFVRTTLGTA